ncbi:MAG: NUDIX pyrophosphatase [Candidatus Marinimicrobia bacterium]|jgi:dATP pyrophosphohydrolase|nr:NUDIX pyrophosphatase [Candidatus Neomarinimicrobiota bacterium]MEC9006765.1 NUDIX domain-containing protein [Candidatus Neomarinimicrobiota bacterium]MEE3302847.1 NUDIX domain-containing protein [Candidatus Neomarinimicrobiota bacterium]|tara:strand:- start:348 stop:812 length:465 start_codon:yes stop_codon:yes gene_type:complete
MTKIITRVVDCYVFNLLDNDPSFLILKRNHNKIYEHLWQGVAGKIEKGETAWQTAIRELKEETGLDPYRMFVADHISKFYEVKGDRINLVPVFGIEVNSKDVILSEEHIEYKWVNFNEARDILAWNGQKEGLEVVYNMISNSDERMRWSKINLE